ncbi:MAG: ribosome rescue protein RqcH [Candidatus Methanofastidiosia archaeon]|jgi:predicted ribosome quality control (RQC) complex YloA/Tae2 family protein
MFSSFDVHEMTKELHELIGMRVNTIYQIDDRIRIKLFGKGRKDLAITKESFYVTRYPRKAPQVPTGFAMQLRKYLKGMWLYHVKHINFDRIVEFHFGYNSKTQYVLVAELFAKGNLILHSQNEIIGVLRKEKWKDRILYPHKTYTYPPSKLPVDIPFEQFKQLEIATEKDLAVNFNFGRLYAKEIFLRSESTSPEDLYNAMHSFEKNANVVLEKDVVPYDLLVYADYEKQFFPTFTEAVDDYYKPEIKELEPKEDRILQSQKKAVINFKEKKEVYKRHGDLIYENYQVVQDVLYTLLEARNKYDWEDITDTIKESDNPTAQKIVSIDYNNGKVTIDVGESITLDLTKDINENAAYYYELSKKMDHKIKGAEKAMEKRKKQIKKEKKKKAQEEPTVKYIRKKEWYEQFHWCFSSDNFLILGGKDRKSNERVVKKYMEPHDLYVHADIQGAPSVIIKNGQSAPDKTIEEAAVVAASYSTGWNHFGSLDCYWVYPEQVTKSPPSGEYLTTGAFFIKGSKNFITVPLEMAIGVYQDKMMAGPVSAVKEKCSEYVIVGFGDIKKERLAKKIAGILKFSDIDEIVRVLPGKGKILNRH